MTTLRLKSFTLLTISGVGLLSQLSFGQTDEIERKCITKSEVIQTAADLVAYVYPDFRQLLKTWKPTLKDIGGEAWEVSYMPPTPINAGSPTVVIGKKSCEVFQIYYHD